MGSSCHVAENIFELEYDSPQHPINPHRKFIRNPRYAFHSFHARRRHTAQATKLFEQIFTLLWPSAFYVIKRRPFAIFGAFGAAGAAGAFGP